MTSTTDLIHQYYSAFNQGDLEGFLALLADDVAHDVNQGAREVGKPAFRAFMERMARHYQEHAQDLVIMANADGSRAAAEFLIVGTYLATDEGLPEARGQVYRLPVGAFFEVANGKVARVTNYYNLADWIAQVGG